MAGRCTTHNRLIVCDRKSGMRFLIDTGANVSVLPVDRNSVYKYSSDKSNYNLYAANGTLIKTYGVKTLALDLGLRRPYTWNLSLQKSNSQY